MPLPAGTRFGPYEIIAPLGAGGMGEVYRARDTRLKREVALKILPEEVAGDERRRARFEQEARAVAALKHPNIVSLYDVGENWFITELVEGSPITGSGLRMRSAVDIAAQVAEGLAAAHAAGITHRDLKPANIMTTRDGHAKILDFGLARIDSSQPDDPTMTAHATEPGVVLGTAGYMSPEQVRGSAADFRSDIFSFGVVLHELLSGQRAFRRPTAAESMAAIANDEPPELPAAVPVALRRIVARCLEKDPGRRFQSASDLAFALRALWQPQQEGAAAPADVPPPWRRPALAALAAVVLIGAGALGGKLLWLPAAPAVWEGSMLGGPPSAMAPRLSPDRSTLAFVTFVDRTSQLAVMKPESGNWTLLTHKKGLAPIQGVTWSADGTRLYFDRMTDGPQGVYSIPALGGEERLVLERAMGPEALPDGSLLVIRINADRHWQVHRFYPSSGRLAPLPAQIPQTLAPIGLVRAFPDGREAVYFGRPTEPGSAAGQDGLFAINLETGRSRLLARSASSLFAISTDGELVYNVLTAGKISRVVAIARSGGEPLPTGITLQSEVIGMDAGPNGSLYVDQFQMPVEVLRFSASGGATERIATSPEITGRAFAIPVPDGRVLMPYPLGDRQRLILAGRSGSPQPFVDSTEETSYPAALAGQRDVAFLMGPPDRRAVAIATVAGGRILRRLPLSTLGANSIQSLAVSSDGATLYYVSERTVWAVPATGGEPRKIRAGDFVASDPRSREIVIQSNQQERFHLFRVDAASGREQEIPLKGDYRLTMLPLAPNAVGPDGRIAVAGASPRIWYWEACIIDPATGEIGRIPVETDGDVHWVGWDRDGKIVAGMHTGRPSVWQFRRVSRER
ncbi:MAG: serine/threonine protein kinase [Acidimicrobiia bacterium]|nr:serine/threonine protein kinase [Acidimicrobiia bacterium]